MIFQWVETDTSTESDRWRLDNNLGVNVSIAMNGDDYGNHRVRIGESKHYLSSDSNLHSVKIWAMEMLILEMKQAAHDLQTYVNYLTSLG